MLNDRYLLKQSAILHLNCGVDVPNHQQTNKKS